MQPEPLDAGAQNFPLSSGQQRLWVLDRLLPRSGIYNTRRALRLRGGLDREALGRALDELVRRHETLRTRFTLLEGEPVQVIEPAACVAVEFDDLSTLPPEEREAEAQQRALAAAQAPFDLERGPLVRACLLRLSSEEHWLLLTLHHIVTDGWSMGILARELSALYGAFHCGEASPLAELPVQYADYALWQREWLQGEALEAQLGYWKQALAELPVLELPTDRPRPAAASYHGKRFVFELDEMLTRELKALSRREGATLFTTLLAAFQVLLYRYSGQEDFPVGVPVGGRARPELEPLIGIFVNMLVLRADLSGAPRFTELLAQVRARALEAYAHQDVPFEKVVEALVTKRDLARNPLFQVAFTKRLVSGYQLTFAGLESADIVETANGTSRFDLAFDVLERAGKVEVLVDYATDLFDAATIERLAGHYRVLLEGIVAEPGRRISELALLTEAERRQLLVEWNDTATECSRERCIHELFEIQAAHSPEVVALEYEAKWLSYRELNARANRLAHHLRSLGVGPEVLVGVCLERSVELVVAILAILKAGGAYVPLDPAYPALRLAFMLEDTAAPVLLTQKHLRERLPAYRGQIVALDEDWPEIARESEHDPQVPISAHHLAYVIYTSGSAGNPKGVMVEQRSLFNHMVWMQRRFPLHADDCVLLKTPSSFDASVWELFAPLTAGARLIVAPPAAHRSPGELTEIVKRRGVTILQLVPSLLAVLLESPGLADCGSLRRVFCGGEQLSQETARRFTAQCAAELVNLYGPTEVTIDSTFHVHTSGETGSSVAIGRPIDNLRGYVVDTAMQLAPVGVPGELLIGGAGVARGYWQQPELTDARFIPDSFAEQGTRMYKTGDLVRYLPDGNLEFLGRTDHQVKIRGFRIELGEIEAALVKHPRVVDAVVTTRGARSENSMVVAYVVLRGGSSLEPGPLRDFLRLSLPEYMIPGGFVALQEFPRTPSGKVDRKRLPALRVEEVEVADKLGVPRNPLEKQLVGIWADVLRLERVGLHQDFFELGGNSLLAVKVVARVCDAEKVRLSVRSLFDNPTVASLARVVDALKRAPIEQDEPSLVPVGREAYKGQTVN